MTRRISEARFPVGTPLTSLLLLGACAVSPGDPSVAEDESLSSCSFAVTRNVYDGPDYWGTITIKNTGSSSVTGFAVQF